jgi:O-antigen/teichoic acid export membrane protein
VLKTIKYLTSHKTIQNISFVTFSNIFNAGLGFIALILVSRNLGPEAFGVFSVIFGLFTLLSKLGDLGSNQTAIRYISLYKAKNETHKEKELIGFFLGITYLFILLTLLFIAPFYRQISEWLNVSGYSSLVLMAIITSGGLVMFNTYSVIFQALERFNDYIFNFTLTTLLKLILVIFVVLILTLNIFNSLLIYFFAPLAGFVAMYLTLKTSVSYELKANLSRKVLKSITPFLYFMAIASISGAILEQLGVFVSKALFTSYETGLYAAAARMSVVFGLIAGSIGTVLIPRASRLQTKDNIQKFAKKSLTLGAVAAAVVLPVVVFPRFFMTITAGPEYVEAASLLAVLSIVGAINLIRGSFVSVFYSLGVPQYFAIKGVLSILIELPLTIIMAKHLGVGGLVYARLVATLFYTFLSIVFYFRSIKNFVPLK